MDLTALFPFAPEVGYIGLTLVSFFGSLIPFVPLPSFLLLATMSVGNQFDLHVMAIISAVAATAAKVTGRLGRGWGQQRARCHGLHRLPRTG